KETIPPPTLTLSHKGDFSCFVPPFSLLPPGFRSSLPIVGERQREGDSHTKDTLLHAIPACIHAGAEGALIFLLPPFLLLLRGLLRLGSLLPALLPPADPSQHTATGSTHRCAFPGIAGNCAHRRAHGGTSSCPFQRTPRRGSPLASLALWRWGTRRCTRIIPR